jgi:hypothetical protein
MKIVLSGIVGGVVVFLWGALSHMALPLGTMGLKTLPGEDAVLAPMRDSIHEPGFYFFPGIELDNPTPEAQAAWDAKMKAGPTGILIYHPSGMTPMSRLFAIELASGILAAILASFIVNSVVAGYGIRVLCVTAMGLFGWLTISVPYWNWYRFPVGITLAEGIDQTVGWLLAGLAIAGIVGRSPRPWNQ